MEKLTVFIVDDDLASCDQLVQQFALSPRFEVAEPVSDGTNAINYITSNRPDIIILDLNLPNYDGLYLINYIQRDIPNYNPFIYVLSVLEIEKTNKILFNFNVHYFSIKPVSAKVIVDNIVRLMEKSALGTSIHSEKRALHDSMNPAEQAIVQPFLNTEDHVDEYLHRLGAPIYRISGRCTKKAILMALECTALKLNMSKLYQATGEAITPSLTSYAVERNVRSTIKYLVTYPTPYFSECFPDYRNGIKNAFFINHSAYLIKKRMD